ncbi:MAG: NAD(P)-binding domain-containing protein, partial [Erysipelotrichaceae bacterium]
MKIRVIGTGSWGTALAQVLCDNGEDVILYGVSKDEVDDINNNHRNSKYFDTLINPKLKASNDFNIVRDADVVLLGVPVMAIESVCHQLEETLDHPVLLINVAKGFHPVTKERLSVAIRSFMNDKLLDLVSLIGPSHAEEVILRKLTTVNSVCENDESA